jgi:hypothetical protein
MQPAFSIAHLALVACCTPRPMPRLLASPDYRRCRSASTRPTPYLDAPVGRCAAPPPRAANDVAVPLRWPFLITCPPPYTPSNPVARRPHLSSGSLACTTACAHSARSAHSSSPCRCDLCIVVLWIPITAPDRPAAPIRTTGSSFRIPHRFPIAHAASIVFTFIFLSPVSPWSAPRALRVPLQYQPHLPTRAHD